MAQRAFIMVLRIADLIYGLVYACDLVLKNCTGLPEKYVYDKNAVGKFCQYFEDGRVDTLKEAINLYVYECRDEAFRNEVLAKEQS